MFVFQNAPMPTIDAGELSFEPVEPETAAAKFDLLLAITATAGQLRARLEYSSDLFDRVTIERLIAHYQRLLQSAIAEPERPVAALEFLADSERREIVRDWNRTRVPFPARSIHELFEAQAKCTPRAIAVASGTTELTYAEVNAYANQLAHHLRSLGVGPESLVGVCLERSAGAARDTCCDPQVGRCLCADRS